MPAGRPTELTPEIIRETRRLAIGGAPIRAIAAYLGISRQQFHLWMKWGDASFEPDEGKRQPPKDRTLYIELADTFARARAEAIMLCEATWLKAVRDGDAAQAAHWLKTHEPSLYKPDADITVEVGVSKALQESIDAVKRMVDAKQSDDAT